MSELRSRRRAPRDVTGLLWGLLFALAAAGGAWYGLRGPLPRDQLLVWGGTALVLLGLLGGLMARRR